MGDRLAVRAIIGLKHVTTEQRVQLFKHANILSVSKPCRQCMRFASEAKKKNALFAHSYVHRPHAVLGRGLEMSDLRY